MTRNDHRAYFQTEYDRLNQSVYEGALPPFPGVDVVDRTDTGSHCCKRRCAQFRSQRPAHAVAAYADGAGGKAADW